MEKTSCKSQYNQNSPYLPPSTFLLFNRTVKEEKRKRIEEEQDEIQADTWVLRENHYKEDDAHQARSKHQSCIPSPVKLLFSITEGHHYDAANSSFVSFTKGFPL